ncbi:MAG: adenylate/guanylate cyclase domain-containing protein [Alphaproteobacteria bacterium]
MTATAEPAQAAAHEFPRADLVMRRLRSATGLVLFSYVLTHLLNHALGLISLEAQDAGSVWFLAAWRNPLGTTVLYGAAFIHIALAIVRLYQRRSLRMPAWEAAQLLLGLTIPPLLAEHVLGTRLANEMLGVTDSYFYVQLVLWRFAPAVGAMQVVVLVVAWLHGCIGLHFWLRLRPWYRRRLPYFYAGALLVPVLSLLGFAEACREVDALAEDPLHFQAAIAALNLPTADAAAVIYRLRDAFLYGFATLIAVVLAARLVRAWRERRRGVVRVFYPGGRLVEVAPGASLLEISRNAGIPHASVCGGRGRCSTCRVRISAGLEQQPPASREELRVLSRVGAPPGVRLACQLRPTSELHVTPLLPSTATARDAAGRPRHYQGEEREIAILFADLRAFTKFSERRLPYDVVFVLNRYFAAMGHAVQEAGGQIDKFIGDGVMALFGVEEGPERGCRSALAAARAMVEQLAELNRVLAHELSEPLRIGIGIHAGPAIVGEMGYERATTLTAVGDAVNTASRLESLTKDYGAELVVSEQVVRYAGLDPTPYPHHEIMVRGRQQPLTILVVADTRSLPAAHEREPERPARAAAPAA